jgi:hypothetical protein
MQAKDNFCCQVANLALLIAHTPSSAVLFRAATSLVLFTGMQRDSLVALRARRVNYYQIAPHSLLFALALLVNNAN